MRFFFAGVVLAAALAGAVWLHNYKEHYSPFSSGGRVVNCCERRPSWAEPAAIALAVVGIGAAAAIVSVFGPRRWR